MATPLRIFRFSYFVKFLSNFLAILIKNGQIQINKTQPIIAVTKKDCPGCFIFSKSVTIIIIIFFKV